MRETHVTGFVQLLARHLAPINPIAVLVRELSDEFSLRPPVAFAKLMYSIQRAENLCSSVREYFLIHTSKMLLFHGAVGPTLNQPLVLIVAATSRHVTSPSLQLHRSPWAEHFA